jgi:preprotein translocase subunit SecD
LTRVAAIAVAAAALAACASLTDPVTEQTFACREDGKPAKLTLADWKVEANLIRETTCKRTEFDASPEWVAYIELNPEGAALLKAFSEKSLGKTISLRVDGDERSEQKIQKLATDGVIRIFGEFEKEEACKIARSLAPSC